MRATETGTSTFSLEKTTVGTSRVRAELVGYFSSSGSFLLWEENVPLLRFDSGNQAKGLLPHLLYLRRMLKEQLPIRMLFKELLQQIILKQLIKRIRMLRVLLFQLPYPRNCILPILSCLMKFLF